MDCLRAIGGGLQQYRAAAPLLERALIATGSLHVIDLCSGGAGPWLQLGPQLQRRLGRPVPVVLTDLYPREQASSPAPGIVVAPFAVDATAAPAWLPGLRTLFTALHHFDPPTARAILQRAVDQGQGIAVFEQTRRSVLGLATMLVLPLLAWLIAPWLRPFRWSRLFWTYVLPAIPLVLMLDGMVSCLRTYEPDELAALVAQLHGQPYTWEIGRVRSPLSPLGVTYLLGWPAPLEPQPGPPAG